MNVVRRISPLRLIILMVLVGMVAGCATLFPPPGDPSRTQKDELGKTLLDQAIQIYQNGEYEQARRRFKALSVSDAGKSVREMAHLGEICSRLMLAETAAEYKSAVDMWKIFRISVSSNELLDALTLLNPLVVRLSATDETQPADPSVQTQPDALPPVKTDDQGVKSELTTLKKKAQRTDQLQRKLDAVTAENQSLKEKIKALETIDQNIQKKKTEMVAPSE